MNSDWVVQYHLNEPFAAAFWLVAVFLYGICLGSFLNVCIWRMPRRESIVSAPSHCTVCGYKINWYDNLPLVSFLILYGRCRHCRAPYSPRYFIVELLTGVLFVLTALHAGIDRISPWILIPWLWLILLAVAAAWIDAGHRIIPDALTYPSMAAAVIFYTVFSVLKQEQPWYVGVLSCIGSGILPGAFLALFAWIGKLIAKQEVMGRGDVKLITAFGMLGGLNCALFSLVAGSLSAVVYGGILALCRRKKFLKSKLAFGPFLGAAAVLWVLAGNRIAGFYFDFIAYLCR